MLLPFCHLFLPLLLLLNRHPPNAFLVSWLLPWDIPPRLPKDGTFQNIPPPYSWPIKGLLMAHIDRQFGMSLLRHRDVLSFKVVPLKIHTFHPVINLYGKWMLTPLYFCVLSWSSSNQLCRPGKVTLFYWAHMSYGWWGFTQVTFM